ncbi:MAG: hypothetical protein J6B22_03725 [Clostridia bacterium]|nr:hypothetical protein [Clostridia bacterium]MBO5321700.1 hypothetical protein [Clostridia bacterium]
MTLSKLLDISSLGNGCLSSSVAADVFSCRDSQSEDIGVINSQGGSSPFVTAL